jgi:hypothetical protein
MYNIMIISSIISSIALLCVSLWYFSILESIFITIFFFSASSLVLVFVGFVVDNRWNLKNFGKYKGNKNETKNTRTKVLKKIIS